MSPTITAVWIFTAWCSRSMTRRVEVALLEGKSKPILGGRYRWLSDTAVHEGAWADPPAG